MNNEGFHVCVSIPLHVSIPAPQAALLLLRLTTRNTAGPRPAEHPSSSADGRDEPLQLFLWDYQKLSGPSTTSHWFLLHWEGRTQGYLHRRRQCWRWAELWPQQPSLDLYVCMKETESQVSIAAKETRLTTITRPNKTPKLQPHRTQRLVNRTRSVDTRSAPSAPTVLPAPLAQSSPNLDYQIC